jgi:hypothetical protein
MFDKDKIIRPLALLPDKSGHSKSGHSSQKSMLSGQSLTAA